MEKPDRVAVIENLMRQGVPLKNIALARELNYAETTALLERTRDLRAETAQVALATGRRVDVTVLGRQAGLALVRGPDGRTAWINESRLILRVFGANS